MVIDDSYLITGEFEGVAHQESNYTRKLLNGSIFRKPKNIEPLRSGSCFVRRMAWIGHVTFGHQNQVFRWIPFSRYVSDHDFQCACDWMAHSLL
jgi:hypothetical protein